MGSIDPNNPGRFLCHGVFDDAGELVHATQDAEQARRFAKTRGLTDHAVVSVDLLDAREWAIVTRMSRERSHRETSPSNERHRQVGRQLDYQTRTRNRT
ncbi:hypothetical protein ACVWYH_005122 [Bradyrhizobium sp. GM24.11]